jgi:hypothetical protein
MSVLRGGSPGLRTVSLIPADSESKPLLNVPGSVDTWVRASRFLRGSIKTLGSAAASSETLHQPGDPSVRCLGEVPRRKRTTGWAEGGVACQDHRG